MGSFETVEALQSQQMFDPSSAHLALNALNPFHPTSVFFLKEEKKNLFIVPHGPLNSQIPPVACNLNSSSFILAHIE